MRFSGSAMTEHRTTTEAVWIAAVETQRKHLGWSQERVGLEAGFSNGYWGKLVRREKKNPTLETVERVNRAVGLELSVAPPL